MTMSRNEIAQNLTQLDGSTIARELGLTCDYVRKVLRGDRKNDNVWRVADVIARENMRRLKVIAKLGGEIMAEENKD